MVYHRILYSRTLFFNLFLTLYLLPISAILVLETQEVLLMQHKKLFTTKKIVLAALMAALTVAGSAIRIKLPISIAGTTAFHLGNIFCALSGILLGPWVGGLAAGMGSAIYDMFDPMYISECWITFIMKGAYGVVDLSEGTEVIVKPRGSSGTADPLDQRSSVGWKGVHAAAILYDEYILRVECGSTYSDEDMAN